MNEGETDFWAYDTSNFSGPSTRRMGVFYNGAMETDRDLTVVILKLLRGMGVISESSFTAFDGMGATGVRGLRIANEVGDCQVTINDMNPDAVELIRRNILANGVENATAALGDIRKASHNTKFDYVDIDPFGTPAPYIESGLASLRRNGVIAISATDTATLFGSYPTTCLRRYDSLSLRCYFSHEIGLRILAGYVIRKAAGSDLCARPLFSYARDHYHRIYFKVSKGAEEADRMLGNIRFLLFDRGTDTWDLVGRNDIHRFNATRTEPGAEYELAGPLFSGKLIHSSLAEVIAGTDLDRICGGFRKGEKHKDLLRRLSAEANCLPFFHCTHEVARRLKTAPIQIETLIHELNKKGITGKRTHFSPTAIKLDERHRAREREIRKMIEGLTR